MFFEEPKTEFVELECEDIIIASDPGGVETCQNGGAPMNNCTDFMD